VTVDGHDPALDQLASIFVTATPDDRVEIELRVHRINAQPAADPWTVGESRGPNRRAWFTAPLVGVYDLPLGTERFHFFEPTPRPNY
jgi:hypothetical protein